MTRMELERASNRAARVFIDMGVEPGDFVTIALPNTIAFYVAIFGALKAGATPMPISHRLPALERNAIIDLAHPALLVGMEKSPYPNLQPDWEPNPSVDDSPLIGIQTAQSWKAMTSGGSTGRPKIIVATAAAEYDPLDPPHGMRVDGTQLVPGPLYHQGPFIFSMYGLFTGATIVLMQRFDAWEALTLIERHRVDWVFLVPTMVHRIWRLPEAQRSASDLSSLNVTMSTGAPFPVWLKEAWIDWLGPQRVLEAYGGTEHMGGTMIWGDEALQRPGSVGRSPQGYGIRILDDAGRELPPREIGEIYFRAPGGVGSTYRYIGAEGKVLGEWESLGDLGYFDEDRYLYLVDRRTDLILSGGVNVYPAEVEAALDSHPLVRSSAVIGLPDQDLGQRVHAIIDIADQTEPDKAALRAYLAERLAPYKLPRSLEFVREPLRDDAGKVRRQALRTARLADTLE